MRAVFLWLGPRWLEHAAGSMRAIGLGLFLAAIIGDEAVQFDLVLYGAIILVISPFVVRAADRLEVNDGRN